MLTQHAYQAVAVEMRRAAELRGVPAVLAREGLPVLLLKGVALAYTLYSEPCLRDRCDTDLKVQESKDGLARKGWKLRLVRLMYQRGHAREDILLFVTDSVDELAVG